MVELGSGPGPGPGPGPRQAASRQPESEHSGCPPARAGGVAYGRVGVSGAPPGPKTYKERDPTRRHSADCLLPDNRRTDYLTGTTCTLAPTAWPWRCSGRASASPGARPAARSRRSSPSSGCLRRPARCSPTRRCGRGSAAHASCTRPRCACTSRRRRGARPSAGCWCCGWWCCGRSTPRSRTQTRRRAAPTGRAATTRASPSTSRSRKSSRSSRTSEPDPSSCRPYLVSEAPSGDPTDTQEPASGGPAERHAGGSAGPPHRVSASCLRDPRWPEPDWTVVQRLEISGAPCETQPGSEHRAPASPPYPCRRRRTV